MEKAVRLINLLLIFIPLLLLAIIAGTIGIFFLLIDFGRKDILMIKNY